LNREIGQGDRRTIALGQRIGTFAPNPLCEVRALDEGTNDMRKRFLEDWTIGVHHGGLLETVRMGAPA
jgi:hypothetical protein